MAETKKSVAKKSENKKPTGYNGLAVGGFVCSLVGLFSGVGFLVGLILSGMGLSQTSKTGQEGRGMALAGVIIGAIGTGLTVLCGVLIAIFIVAVASSANVIDRATDTFHSKCTYEHQYDKSKHKYNYELVCE